MSAKAEGETDMTKQETTTEIQAVQTWENSDFGTVRTVMQEGDPWFVAKDVASILGFKQANDMTKRLDEDEQGVHYQDD